MRYNKIRKDFWGSEIEKEGSYIINILRVDKDRIVKSCV